MADDDAEAFRRQVYGDEVEERETMMSRSRCGAAGYL